MSAKHFDLKLDLQDLKDLFIVKPSNLYFLIKWIFRFIIVFISYFEFYKT